MRRLEVKLSCFHYKHLGGKVRFAKYIHCYLLDAFDSSIHLALEHYNITNLSRGTLFLGIQGRTRETHINIQSKV